MVSEGSRAFLICVIDGIPVMTVLLNKVAHVRVLRLEPCSGAVDEVSWRKTVFKLCHLSLWLGFLVGAALAL